MYLKSIEKSHKKHFTWRDFTEYDDKICFSAYDGLEICILKMVLTTRLI